MSPVSLLILLCFLCQRAIVFYWLFLSVRPVTAEIMMEMVTYWLYVNFNGGREVLKWNFVYSIALVGNPIAIEIVLYN